MLTHAALLEDSIKGVFGVDMGLPFVVVYILTFCYTRAVTVGRSLLQLRHSLEFKSAVLHIELLHTQKWLEARLPLV